uniref:Reverse transcriptase domain-containing protein n=1 Tax=Podarcis muralis TaxID=64176 RepID=A0A670J379_PODMU
MSCSSKSSRNCTLGINGFKKKETNHLYNEWLAYRASNDPMPNNHLITLRRSYKALLKEKKLEAERNNWNNLLIAAENRNPASFWQLVSRYLGRPLAKIEPHISADTWERYFADLYAAHDACGDTVEPEALPDWDPVTCPEVEILIDRFKAGKAPGDDLISIDAIKANKDWWIPLLAALYTHINKTAKFPSSWSSALIVLIHKKGPRTEPSNFRPISLLNVIGKIYSGYLLNKLSKWMEDDNIIADEQAGFRPGRSTTDQILTLNHLAEKYAGKAPKVLHVAFIDLKQAFDRISRKQLWTKLAATKIDRRLLHLIISLHTNTFLRIRLNKGLVSNPVTTTRGVRQGCLLAPALFSFYINSLVTHMANDAFHPPKLAGRSLNVLLYADDAALLARSPIGLRRMLQALHEYCDQHELQPNYAKTKIMVFSARPRLHRWSMNGIPLEQVNCFKYLGQVIRSNRTFLAHRDYITTNASKAAIQIRSLYAKNQAQSVKIALRLFQMKVLPLLLVGISLGSRRDFLKLDSIQTQFLRAILRIPPSVAGAVMRLEVGWQALRYVALKTKLWLWLKLCFKPVGIAPLILRDDFQSSWEREVINEVQSCGLSHLYFESMTYNQARAVISRRLSDIARQEDIAQVKPGMFLGDQIYRTIPAPYLAEIHYVEYRRLLTAARLNVLDSAILWGRYRGVPYAQRTCHCAMGAVESTEHILLACPSYAELRQNFIDPLLCKFSFLSGENQVLHLLNNATRAIPSLVAKFLFLAFKRRKTIIDCIDMGLSV